MKQFQLDNRRYEMMEALYERSGRTCNTYTGLWEEFCLDVAANFRDTSYAELHAACITATIRHLASKYPGAEEWPLFLTGSSMGSGRACLASGALIKQDFDVPGIFLSSLKWQDITKSVKTFSPSKNAIRNLKVYISQGEKDFYATKAQSLTEAEEIREAGVKDVRHEVHPGKGGMDAASLTKALEWFEEAEK